MRDLRRYVASHGETILRYVGRFALEQEIYLLVATVELLETSIVIVDGEPSHNWRGNAYYPERTSSTSVTASHSCRPMRRSTSFLYLPWKQRDPRSNAASSNDNGFPRGRTRSPVRS